MEELIWYDITCHTESCSWNNIVVHGQGPENTLFMCGPCGNMIDDWKVSENQTDSL